MCGTEPEDALHAFVSVNSALTEHRPDLALSTAAHELGHLVFDVPAMLRAGGVRYRAIAAGPGALDQHTRDAEGRANEFMGALLTPPMALHTRLLKLAHAEGLRLVRGRHLGRPGGPVLAVGNPRDSVAGVIAALAADFGVSDRFVGVRLRRYGLVQEGAI
jgi:Zn-dependent peptidase ImmA (M78 family)